MESLKTQSSKIANKFFESSEDRNLKFYGSAFIAQVWREPSEDIREVEFKY